MAKNYAEIAFSTAIKKIQEKSGSRAVYARMERNAFTNGLTEHEVAFIGLRDSFYMATNGENGYPYIQHRGGLPGFVKVLDANRIGFIDFRGNKQFISVGNLVTNNKVAIIMLDYPARARLKIYAQAKIVELGDDEELYTLLDLKEYKFKAERMIVLHIDAYDWNCPQHITPRYTLEEIEEAFNSQENYIKELEAEIEILKSRTNPPDNQIKQTN